MLAEQWKRLRAAYDAVMDAPEADRQRLVDELSGSDPDLGRELSRLLGADPDGAAFLDTPLARLVSPRLAAGAVLAGRFTLLRPLGQGGLGEVWCARDQSLNDEVAIKMVHVAGSAPQDLRRFTREIQLARRISHPAVCRVYEFFEDVTVTPPRAFLTMELLEGETLAARLRRSGPMPAVEALAVFRQIAQGLGAAHDAGVIHRDLKPANIMLVSGSSTRQAVVMDFGLARDHVRVESDGTTMPGMLVGTPEYMAPEQVSGGAVTPATDIYALGLILFEMLRGTRPFASSSTLDSWMRRAREGPERLSGAVPGVQGRIDGVIRSCLEYEPARRPQSVSQLLRAIDNSFYIPLPRSRRFWTGAVAAAVLVAVTLIVGGLRLRWQEAAVPAAASVLLTDVINGTGDEDLDGATEVLRGQLSQSPVFELVSAERIGAALRGMKRPPGDRMEPEVAREVALREGAPLVAFATITRLASDYEISVRLEEVGSNPSLVRNSWERRFVAGSKRDLFAAVDDAARWVRESIGEAPADLATHLRPPADTTTSSWEALRLFARARTAAAGGDAAGAALLLGEAIRFDPEFATAHRQLGDLLLSLRRETEAIAAWREAVRLVDQQQLTTRESARIRAQYLEDTGDVPGAEQAYRTYLQHYPNDYAPHVYLASVLMDLGRTAEAIPWFTKAATLRRGDYVSVTHLARALIDVGRWEEASSQIRALRAMGAADWATWLEGVMAFTRGDVAAALAAVEPLRTSSDPAWRSRAFVVRASWLAERGADDAARRDLMDGLAFDAAQGLREREAGKWLLLAALHCRRGDVSACADACARAMTINSTPQMAVRAGTLLARAGRIAEARQVLERLRDEPDVPRVEAVKLRLQGEIDLARGRTAVALPLLMKAGDMLPTRRDRLFLARAQRIAGRLEEARRTLADFVEHPVRAYFEPEPELPGIYADTLDEYIRTLTLLELDTTPYVSRYQQLRTAQ